MKKKVNEAVYRSPKWMRNFMDFEINTGKDIKGEPNAKAKAKAEKEKNEQENKRKSDKDDKFYIFLDSLINFIKEKYDSTDLVKDVKVKRWKISKTISSVHLVVNCVAADYGKVDALITMRTPFNEQKLEFEIFIKTDKDKFEYCSHPSSLNGTEDWNLFEPEISHYGFYQFVVDDIVPWWREKQQKNKKKEENENNYKDPGGYTPPKQNRHEPRQNKGFEADPAKNRLRRLALLRTTLEGYERELERYPVGHPERERCLRDIELVKGRIRAMENPKNENLHHLVYYQVFEKTYNPAVGEYYMMTHPDTHEPVPCKIEKVFPNGTYNVSFNVEGSIAKGAPNCVIKNSDIISPYKPIRSPVGSGFVSANTNMQVRNTTNVNQVSNDMYL